ncbi:MAG: FtsW/RodA/SpoVE family cell cycle protein, partial [Pseudomonadota bacterium]
MHWPLVMVLCVVASVGTAMLYSVAGGAIEPYAARHASRFVLCLAMVFVMAALPLRFWMAIAYPAYALVLALLLVVAFAGVESGGAHRWIAFGGVTFQPSEFAKVAIVLAL